MIYSTATLTGYAQELAITIGKLADLGRSACESNTDVAAILHSRLQTEIAKASNWIAHAADEVIDEIPF